ncbi:MAG: TetR/AcrR family transcriptional regulator [Lachnospiraceae bacterium]|nr:TetR/AcrR family transcriptional regulator [Lachnospiraceae bacterium]
MNGLLKIPHSPKGRETLNNILSAAAQLIYEKGYHLANIADITKLAGVATGTFYIYFDSKISLYRYLLLQFGHQIRQEMSVKTANCTTRREKEREGLKAWLEYVRKHPYVYSIIYESIYVDKHLFEEYYETFNKAYTRGLSEDQKNGDVIRIDTTVLSYVLMGISSFTGMKYCLIEQNTEDIDYIVDEVMKLLDHGMFCGGKEKKEQDAPAKEEKQEMNFRVEVDFDLLNRSGKNKEEG